VSIQMWQARSLHLIC